MPDQPADPIHYDMKIPPEPKNRDQENESLKKHGDKIDSAVKPGEKDDKREEQKDSTS